MIVVDASPIIDLLRGIDTPSSVSLQAVLDTPVRLELPGLVRYEVLQGVRNLSELRIALLTMESFSHVVLPAEAQFYERAAGRYRALRQRGITIRSSVDTLIAGYCIETEAELLTGDRDFGPFAEHFGLSLVVALPPT